MNQHEITERRPLLDASGNLTEPGYAKSLLPVYRRGDIKANKLRIKEWDYYCINNGHFALALTIADNSYMGARLHLPAQPRRGVGDHEKPDEGFHERQGLPAREQ